MGGWEPRSSSRVWVPVGERLHREFQRENERKIAGQGALLNVAVGDCAKGAVKGKLQQGLVALYSGRPAGGS